MYILSAQRNSIGQNLTPIKDKNPPQISKRILAQSNGGHLPRNKQKIQLTSYLMMKHKAL